jgi:hypothetical protein
LPIAGIVGAIFALRDAWLLAVRVSQLLAAEAGIAVPAAYGVGWNTDGVGKSAMAAVLITCPRTRRPVATGLDLDTLSFIWATLRDQRFRCPACGRTHIWDKEDAYLPAHPPKPPPGGFRNFAWFGRASVGEVAAEGASRIPWPWVQIVAAILIVFAAWFLAEGPGGVWFAGILGR